MSGTIIYGIKNCNTMQKAMAWLDMHSIAYIFHDYKKQGADEAILKEAIATHGWETVINKKGMTWRNLPDEAKASMNERKAIETALDNPSIIKRPLLTHKGKTYLGFDEAVYQTIFN